MAKKNEDNNITSRIAELMAIYQDLSQQQMSLARPMIENMAFIEQEMAKLQEVITVEGGTDEYMNGANQFGRKQSANIQSYNALVKSYNTLNARLEKMLPKQKASSRLESLMDE